MDIIVCIVVLLAIWAVSGVATWLLADMAVLDAYVERETGHLRTPNNSWRAYASPDVRRHVARLILLRWVLVALGPVGLVVLVSWLLGSSVLELSTGAKQRVLDTWQEADLPALLPTSRRVQLPEKGALALPEGEGCAKGRLSVPQCPHCERE